MITLGQCVQRHEQLHCWRLQSYECRHLSAQQVHRVTSASSPSELLVDPTARSSCPRLPGTHMVSSAAPQARQAILDSRQKLNVYFITLTAVLISQFAHPAHGQATVVASSKLQACVADGSVRSTPSCALRLCYLGETSPYPPAVMFMSFAAFVCYVKTFASSNYGINLGNCASPICSKREQVYKAPAHLQLVELRRQTRTQPSTGCADVRRLSELQAAARGHTGCRSCYIYCDLVFEIFSALCGKVWLSALRHAS